MWGIRRQAKVQPGKLEKARSCVGLPALNHRDLLPQLTGVLPPSPPARMVYLGSVCNSLEILRQQKGTCKPGSLGSLSGSVCIPGVGRCGHPQESWPLARLPPCPAYHHSGSPVASEETGQEGGSWGTGCGGAQGGNEGSGPWVDLDCNVCGAPFVFLNVMDSPTLTTLALGGIPCSVVKACCKILRRGNHSVLPSVLIA